MCENIYVQNGFKDRDEYLASLCEKYREDHVYTLADMMGPGEDFDGLIVNLEDSSSPF